MKNKMLGGIRISSVAPILTTPPVKTSEYPKRRIFGMAISDITEAAAKLAPDMAPNIPQAKTVPIATPPRIFEVQLYAALYMSVASPPEEVRNAMRMNIGTADKM